MVENDEDLPMDAGAPGAQTGSGMSTHRRADPASAVMRLLAEGVPLTLLADLTAPDGPASQVILETEGLPDDAWWEADLDADTAADQESDEPARDPDATPV
ncbi:MAG: hypothetical protein ACOH17_01355 [Cellulomonas sp.]